MKNAKQLLPLLAATVVLLLLFRVRVPNFLALENMLDLAQQVSINAILAFGMTLTILIGGIDLSVGALLALVGTTTVYLLAADPRSTVARKAGPRGAGWLGCGGRVRHSNGVCTPPGAGARRDGAGGLLGTEDDHGSSHRDDNQILQWPSREMVEPIRRPDFGSTHGRGRSLRG